MRSGDRSPRPARGFTYVAVLIAVAAITAGLAAAAEVWSHARQREKEAALLFAGDQFRQAISTYYESTPGGAKRYPQKLEDLLEDNRFPTPRRHLRRLYPDPVSGRAEWGLMAAPDGGIMGVYSLSGAVPIKRARFASADRTFQGASSYYEWRFYYEPPLATAPAPQIPPESLPSVPR